MPTSNGEAASFSEVDSQRFGVRVARARVDVKTLTQALDFCSRGKIDLLIARCSTRDLGTVQRMEAAGFQLMDTLVYYTFDLGKRRISEETPRACIRKFTHEDTPQIERVAAAAFASYYGHYHADSRLDRSKCDEGYASWAVRSCSKKQAAEEVLVAELDRRIIGFATLRVNSPEEGEVLLFGIAPEVQGAGIGGALISGAAEWGSEQRLRRLTISTQLTNIAAQKMWCRAGFEPSHSYYTLHKWFPR